MLVALLVSLSFPKVNALTGTDLSREMLPSLSRQQQGKLADCTVPPYDVILYYTTYYLNLLLTGSPQLVVAPESPLLRIFAVRLHNSYRQRRPCDSKPHKFGSTGSSGEESNWMNLEEGALD